MSGQKFRLYILSLAINCISTKSKTKNTNDVFGMILSVDGLFEAEHDSARKRKLAENHAGNK